MSELLHPTDFEPLLHSEFSIQFTPDVALQAELTSVTILNGYTPVDRKPFSLVFRTAQKN